MREGEHRKFLRLPGNAVNALLVKLPAQGIPEQVNTRYCPLGGSPTFIASAGASSLYGALDLAFALAGLFRFVSNLVILSRIRSDGCRDLLVYCISGRCYHSATLSGDWSTNETPVRSLCSRMVWHGAG